MHLHHPTPWRVIHRKHAYTLLQYGSERGHAYIDESSMPALSLPKPKQIFGQLMIWHKQMLLRDVVLPCALALWLIETS